MMTSIGTLNHQDAEIHEDASYQVASVNWKGYFKRIRLEPGTRWLDIPLSACVSTGDIIRFSGGDAWVLCRNGTCQILQPYVVEDTIRLGASEVKVLVKEITEPEEHRAYQSLADYHYRGARIHGRTSRIIIRTFHPLYPKVLGYVELATPFFMNKARSVIFDAPFQLGDIAWERWDAKVLRKYVHLVVRIARTVVSPEFRGAGVGQMLVRHATAFAAQRWQVSGYLPLFLEISADMLKFVPFVEKAGMLYVGETQGNLRRVAKDMHYLINRFGLDSTGKLEFGQKSGILDQQITRMDRAIKLMEQEGMDLPELIRNLNQLSQKTVLRRFALFHGIVSLPKPHYMLGLLPEASAFLDNRVHELGISNIHQPPDITISPLNQPIKLEQVSITYTSRVRRTSRTHAVQQAFDISPDEVRTTVISNMNLTINPGDIVLLLGPSGSGKTTILNMLLDHPKLNNSIEMEGNLRVPTDFQASTFAAISSSKPLIELIGEKDLHSCLYLLGLAGLSEPILYLKRFQELSRGQQYRAMLARLIATRANVWLIDEFCVNLDPATANLVAHNIQRIARRIGATLIVAAPHANHFFDSLKPDTVVVLSTNWEYAVLSKSQYTQVVNRSVGVEGPPRLRLLPKMIDSVKRGVKRATTRKGRRIITPGLLILSDGQESITVRVTSSVCKSFAKLNDYDAHTEGMADENELKGTLKEIYPQLRDRSLVTVIYFERLWGELATELGRNGYR